MANRDPRKGKALAPIGTRPSKQSETNKMKYEAPKYLLTRDGSIAIGGESSASRGSPKSSINSRGNSSNEHSYFSTQIPLRARNEHRQPNIIFGSFPSPLRTNQLVNVDTTIITTSYMPPVPHPGPGILGSTPPGYPTIDLGDVNRRPIRSSVFDPNSPNARAVNKRAVGPIARPTPSPTTAVSVEHQRERLPEAPEMQKENLTLATQKVQTGSSVFRFPPPPPPPQDFSGYGSFEVGSNYYPNEPYYLVPAHFINMDDFN